MKACYQEPLSGATALAGITSVADAKVGWGCLPRGVLSGSTVTQWEMQDKRSPFIGGGGPILA